MLSLEAFDELTSKRCPESQFLDAVFRESIFRYNKRSFTIPSGTISVDPYTMLSPESLDELAGKCFSESQCLNIITAILTGKL